MPIAALFDINLDGEDRGYQAANAESLSLKLRDPSGASTVVFQVYSAAAVDTSLGIAANPPRASSGAPMLTLVGATSGQAVSPSTVGGAVTVAMPGSGSHSWLIRCVVNGGRAQLPNGTTVVDPSLVFERGVYIPTGFSTRKIIATESQQFAVEGWAEAINDLITTGVSPGAFQPAGEGAVLRSVNSRLGEEVFATDFMTAAEITDCLDGTLLFDMQPAIQAAVDYGLYRSDGPYSPRAAGPRVKLPGGVLRIDRPVNLGYGLDFRSVIFEGEGDRYGGDHGVQGSGTVLVATFNTAPAIVIQAGYHVIVRDMAIEGAHSTFIANKINAAGQTMADLAASAWVDPALPAAASSRYAPYAGIAIDPYSGVRPGTSYPDVIYPDWLGAVPQYGKYPSSACLVENVSISGFVVAIVSAPADADGNGDFIKLRRVVARFCVYGYSWGNTQARVTHFEGCIFSAMHTALSTGIYGRRTGEPGAHVASCSFDALMQIVDIPNMNYGQGPTFISCFAEGIYSIGNCYAGNAVTAGGISFRGCQFGFTWWTIYGAPTWVFQWRGSMGQALFENCLFYMPGTQGGFLSFRSDLNLLEAAKSFQFINCQITEIQTGLSERYQMCAFNATMGVVVTYGSTCLDRYSFSSGFCHNLDTGADAGPLLYTELSRGPRTLCLPVYAKRIQSLSEGSDPGVPVSWRIQELACDVTSIAGREVTFVAAGVTTASLMHTGGDVGDVLLCKETGAAFLVKSRTGTTLVARAVAGFDSDGALLSPVLDGHTMRPINCRRYAISLVVYANITATSPTATNVVGGNGDAPELPSHFTVGDYLYVDSDVETTISPADARIVSIDNVAKTITFAGPFLFTQARRRIAIFVRPAMPNAA